MQEIKIWLVSFISFIILDLAWLSGVASKFYREKLAPIAKLKPDGSLDFSYGAGVVVYILMATAMVVFVWPKIKSGNHLAAVGYSALMGVVVYGVYDFTNLSFAKYWPINFAVVDILWGAVAFALVGLIISFFR